MKKLWILLPIVLVTALLGWRLFGGGGHSDGVHLAPLVLEVAPVQQMKLPLYLTAAGQAVSSHSVAVRAQVSGQLAQVHFREGDAVTKGELLFVIAPAPFEAALLGAKAAWQSADANAKRTRTLLKQKFVTEQDVENAAAAADKALADLRLAEINLAYTRIRAPIAGRTGLLAVKSGNLVVANEASPLVSINQMSPMEVQFALPQQHLAALRKAGHDLTVQAMDETGSKVLASGKLVFVANAVDTTTGTIALKASFPNRDEALWPGQFVTVRVVLAEDEVLTMPAAALQTGQDGNFVYQVKDGKTVITAVQLQREQGGLALIAKGLMAGDEVVTRAPRNLRAGMPASVRESDADAVHGSVSP